MFLLCTFCPSLPLSDALSFCSHPSKSSVLVTAYRVWPGLIANPTGSVGLQQSEGSTSSQPSAQQPERQVRRLTDGWLVQMVQIPSDEESHYVLQTLVRWTRSVSEVPPVITIKITRVLVNYRSRSYENKHSHSDGVLQHLSIALLLQ